MKALSIHRLFLTESLFLTSNIPIGYRLLEYFLISVMDVYSFEIIFYL